MNKMVINHLDKLFVTNDAATIVNELEVQHPAAKILVLAGKAQQEEIGDGANLTVSFAGELLQNAEELIRMGLHPSEIIIGYTKSINKVTIVKNEQGGNSVSTVVLRGSTDSILDDLERAVDDGVNAYKAMCRDSRIVPGAAATEIELARRLKEFSFKETGLDQYAIAKFAESFEMIPKTLAENAGLNAIEIISSLYAEHASGNTKVGIDLEEGVCKDISTMNIWDLHITKFVALKFFALKYAADAACTVLRVDQIIMAKPAGVQSPHLLGWMRIKSGLEIILCLALRNGLVFDSMLIKNQTGTCSFVNGMGSRGLERGMPVGESS
ncbi:UNVERIFIED_CONTAM: T-complex protein 1 subunit theta [Sesamum latifolium]|uniref:T-complex protein 1 subunit theta n=1 Tax=Sesamum latifolium TaxID=2727402 RepID=A0AAW2VHM2_9LAMI